MLKLVIEKLPNLQTSANEFHIERRPSRGFGDGSRPVERITIVISVEKPAIDDLDAIDEILEISESYGFDVEAEVTTEDS